MASQIDLITGDILNANSDDWRDLPFEADSVAEIMGENTLLVDFEAGFYGVDEVDRSAPRQLSNLSGQFTAHRVSESIDYGVTVQHGAPVRPLRAFAGGAAVRAGDGLRVRPPVTNLYPNPRHIGGAPGQLPTGLIGVYTGSVMNVIGAGSNVFGDYLELEFNGTPATQAPEVRLQRASWTPNTPGNFITAIQYVSGDVAAVSGVDISLLMRDAGGIFIGHGGAIATLSSAELTAESRPVMVVKSATAAELSNPALDGIDVQIRLGWTSGAINNLRVRLYLLHLDQAAYPSSPHRTAPGAQGVAVRDGDNIDTAVGGWLRQDEFTAWARFIVPDTIGETHGAFNFNSVVARGFFAAVRTDLDRIDFIARNDSGIFGLYPNFAAHSVERGKSCVIAFARSDNLWAAAVNGVDAGEIATTGAFSAVTTLRLGRDYSGGATPFEHWLNAPIQQFGVIPRFLNATERAALTINPEALI